MAENESVMVDKSVSAMERLRLAGYFAPAAESALAVAASRWLGRTAADARNSGGCDVPGVPGYRLQQYRLAPFHYGFHATLKPPFRLRDGATVDDVRGRLARFCSTRRAVVLPPLQVSEIGTFLCLRPMSPCGAIQRLAADLVEQLDPCRRPPDAAELARRRRTTLTARQQQLLLRWGYPYVFEEFRFHLTLTGSIADDREKEIIRRFLEDHFAEAVRTPVVLDRISLFVEDDGHPLVLSATYPLTTE